MSTNSMDAKASVGLANSLSNVFKLVSPPDNPANPRFTGTNIILSQCCYSMTS